MIWVLPALMAGKAAATLWLARGQVNDNDVPVSKDLFPESAPRTAMAIWAHPDDEITSAGTLSAMARSGAELTLVYLTAGEAAKHPHYSPKELAEVRRQEAEAAGRTLGARHVAVLSYPDGGLPGHDGEMVKAEIAELIARFEPSLIISFDEQVGFYGHRDHVQTGRWVREVVEAGAPSVRRLYQATLPRQMIALALKLVQAFRDQYPKEPEAGLPAPTVAVNITRQAAVKRALLDVHVSQAAVVDDVQPFARKAPPWLYYRLFDREYFTLVVERA